jgi:hypothetical protein
MSEQAPRCETCVHWSASSDDWQCEKAGFGECKRIILLDRVTDQAAKAFRAQGRRVWDNADELGAAELELLKIAKAVCVDASSYYAALRTAPDFGCVLHVLLETTPPPQKEGR